MLGPNGAGKSTLLSADRGTHPGVRRPHLARRQVARRRRQRHFRRGGAAPGGLRLPGLPALPAPQRAGQRGLLAAGARATAGPRPARPPTTGWTGSGLTDLARRRPGRPVRRAGAARRARTRAGRRPGAAAARRAAVRARRPHPPRRADRAQAPPCRTSPGHACSSPTTRWRRSCWPTGCWSSSTAGSCRRAPPPQVARRPATEYVARLVGLNLYAGTADGAHVTLDRGRPLRRPRPPPARGGPRGAAPLRRRGQPAAGRTSPAPATPGRPRSPGSPCSPTGSASTSRGSRPPWST